LRLNPQAAGQIRHFSIDIHPQHLPPSRPVIICDQSPRFPAKRPKSELVGGKLIYNLSIRQAQDPEFIEGQFLIFIEFLMFQ